MSLPTRVSLGTSKSSSESQQNSTQAASSHVTAGRDLNIVATGDSSQATATNDTGNINVIGSDLSAGRNATLVADNAINMQAAQDNSQQTSSNKSSSASIGASFSTTTGFSVNASASKGKGNSNGSDTTYTNSHLSAGNIAQTESGTDTTLAGASIQANRIIADVGTKGTGNFNIASLQDTSTYQAKQSSAGFSINVPVGGAGIGGSVSASKSNTNSNYASVNEQSGLKAGDGGFQVNVNGNTDLKGAVIASTDKAIQDNKNSLTTQTLSTSNIENKADYQAESMSVSAGGGLNKQSTGELKNAPTASAGMAEDQGNANSTTVSGISAGKVAITNNPAQTTRTGQDTTTTLALLNRDVTVKQSTDAMGNTTRTVVDSQGNNTSHTLSQIFNQAQVQQEMNTQVQITQAFSQVAPKAVADYAQSQYDKLKTTDPAEAAKWAEGGIYRIAMHTALGGLTTGDVAGAAGAGTVAGLATQLDNLQNQVSIALIQAGVSTETAKTVSQGLAELTALGVGNAVGGNAAAASALVVDTNNRQLHPREIDLLTKREVINSYRKRILDTEGKDLSIADALLRLGTEAYSMNDAAFNSGFPHDQLTQAFLLELSNQYGGFTDSKGNVVQYFKSTNAQYNNSGLYSGGTEILVPTLKYTAFNTLLNNPDLLSKDPAARANAEAAISMLLLSGSSSNKPLSSKPSAVEAENWGIGQLRWPAIRPKLNEDVIISPSQGLQSKTKGLFENVIMGNTGEQSTKYLYTVDGRGVNIALENTPVATNSVIKHTNISPAAAVGGEVWFGPNNTVTINGGSGRYGDGAGITEQQWQATINLWKSLGYKVNAIPFGQRQ